MANPKLPQIGHGELDSRRQAPGEAPVTRRIQWVMCAWSAKPVFAAILDRH